MHLTAVPGTNLAHDQAFVKNAADHPGVTYPDPPGSRLANELRRAMRERIVSQIFYCVEQPLAKLPRQLA
ncbi:hypothetical protein ACI1US_02112 [Leucobacter sp. BZR 635]